MLRWDMSRVNITVLVGVPVFCLHYGQFYGTRKSPTMRSAKRSVGEISEMPKGYQKRESLVAVVNLELNQRRSFGAVIIEVVSYQLPFASTSSLSCVYLIGLPFPIRHCPLSISMISSSKSHFSNSLSTLHPSISQSLPPSFRSLSKCRPICSIRPSQLLGPSNISGQKRH
jgi:hypothetical protein